MIFIHDSSIIKYFLLFYRFLIKPALYMIYQKNHKICEFAFSYFITFRYNHFIKYKGVFLWLKLRKKAK
ncbi:hypothetical protein FIU23_04005 [Enterococcus faecalis]|nr:hypothetical protein FA027_12930 [Enterococcus faecalis]QDD49051.1 hypothetical protein FIU23_04005 [Enterococcus faecalis]